MTRVRPSLRVVVLTSIVAGVASLGVTAPVGAAPLNTTLVTIPNSAPAPGAQFGLAVQPTGDVNGDTVADLAVGAPGSDRVDGYSTVRPGAKIRSIGDPENKPGNAFGWALANVADLNGDGVADLAVGARGREKPDRSAALLPRGGMHPCAGAGSCVRLLRRHRWR